MLGQACTIKDKEGANLVKAKYLRYSGIYEILYIENMFFLQQVGEHQVEIGSARLLLETKHIPCSVFDL